MSAEVLRQAASLMRADWEVAQEMSGIAPTDPHWRRAKCWLAVADWLEEVAERQKPTTRHGRRNHGWTGSAPANTVARAYLGSDQ